MYQYNNTGYNSQPASVENIPHRRPVTEKRPPNNAAKTVGIGYYGVQKNKPSADSGVRNITSPISPAGSSMRSLGSPTDNQSHLQSTFNNNKSMDYNDSWNYLDADVDLSPRVVPRSSTRDGLTDSRNLRSPVRPLSEGSIVDSYTRNRLSPSSQNQNMGQRNEFDRSTVSTNQSDPNHSGSTFRQDRGLSYSAPTVDTGQPSVMSLREKWEIGKRGIQDYKIPAGSHQFPVRNRNITTAHYNDSILRRTVPAKDSVTSPTPTQYSRQSNVDTLNRSVFSNDQSAESTMERDYSTASLRRDPITHRKIPNGVAKPVRNGSLNTSRRSLSWSRLSLKSQGGKVTVYGKGYGVHNSLVNMALAAILSLVMSILGIQLLFRVSAPATPGLHTSDSVLRTNVSYFNVSEVVIALACITVMLDLCCLLTCSMQGYFAAKLIKCSQGEERAFRYLKECMPTRFISIVGFFLSVPVYFFALMLYVLMEYRSTPAIIAVVVLTIGVSFLVSMTVHSTYIWLAEKSCANEVNIQGVNNNNKKRTKVINGELTNQNELSTLV